MKVNVITTYDSPNSLGFIYPILTNRDLLYEKGIRFNFYDRINANCMDCDIVFLNSKVFKNWHLKKEKELYNTLKTFKDKDCRVIWFDTNDSTGTTQFNIMPFVDGYYKSQILKDKSLYRKPFYGFRIFTDYYKSLFNIRDNETDKDRESQNISVGVTLKPEYEDKLHVSWNSAMNEWGSYNYLTGPIIAKLISSLKFKANYTVKFENPDRKRPITANGRIGISHTRNTVGHQRKLINKILMNKFHADTSKISRRRYLQELKKSKIGVSPFGLGEISCRDFEVIMNGALLFKQDMSHMQTWPNLYVNNETYLPFSWDLNDLEDKLSHILSEDKEIVRMVENAQRAYKYYLYGDGRFEFCDKVINIVKT